MFFSKSGIILCLRCRSIINFDVIFMEGVKFTSVNFSLNLYPKCSKSFVGNYPFSMGLLLHFCQKVGHICVGFLLDNLFPIFSICPFLLQYCTILITIAFNNYLKSESERLLLYSFSKMVCLFKNCCFFLYMF